MIEIPCEECKINFLPSRKGNVCCSKQCSYNFWYKKNKEAERQRSYAAFLKRRNPLRSRICPICDVVFQTPYKQSRCCSKSCWWKLHYKEHRNAHREKVRLIRLQNVTLYRAKDKAYHTANRERVNMKNLKNSLLRRKRYPWHAILNGAKTRSKKESMAFDLNAAWCKSRWTGNCELTGIAFVPAFNRQGPSMFSPSIDKIIPSLGYVEGNCRFVLWAVNAMKGRGTDSDMYRIAETLLLRKKHAASITEAIAAAMALPG